MTSIMGPIYRCYLGNVVIRRVGERGCLGHPVFYIYSLTICPYELSLGLDTWVGTPITPPSIIKHAYPFGMTPVGTSKP